jgi:hypothetical protein
LSPGASGYTSTVPPSGSTAGTVQVGYPQSYTTVTTTIAPAASPYTSTVSAQGTTRGTVIVATPSAAPAGSFSCDARGYLVQQDTSGVTRLYSVNITAGTNTLLSPDLTAYNSNNPINGMGFNVLDNYLYAYSKQGQIVRLNTTKATVVKQLTGTFAQTYNSADIDSDGYYWLINTAGQWQQIDMRPDSSTYLQTLSSGTSTFPGASGTYNVDWVYVPSQGQYLYALLRNPASPYTNQLARWSMTDHTWTTIGSPYTQLTGQFGAAYGSNNGSMWVSNNADGKIWRIDLANPAVPVLQSTGPGSQLNDGARCIYG